MRRTGGFFLALVLFLLSGCQYPESEYGRFPNETQLEAVQKAVDRFQEENEGLLPIKTTESDRDLFIKYPIDFHKLVPRYLGEIPESAYENGGNYQYVLINVEQKPVVKIFDLTIAETIREIKLRLSMREYPPYSGNIGKNVFTLDFSRLGYKERPSVKSPFTGYHLPFVIDGSGEIFVDYSGDLEKILKESADVSITPGEDIRWLLTEHSPFVPAFSKPYTVDEEGNPVFLEE
jgi:hypothetical protein